MPPVVNRVPGLRTWTVTLESGEQRTALGTSAQAVMGNAPNIVSVVRGGLFAGEVAPPVAGTLTPSTAAIGAPNFTLHVAGSGFGPGCQIFWNGAAEPTTVVSPTEVTTDVNMATAQVAMPIPVFVRSIAGMDSNVLTFTLTAAE